LRVHAGYLNLIPTRRGGGLLLLALLAAPGALTAQRAIDLTGVPDGRIADAFSHIAGVRELSGGRVVVTDQMERRLFLGDFANGKRRQVGRDGDGPGEYRFPTAPLAALDGSTFVFDPTLRRVHVVTDSATFARSLAPPYGSARGGLLAARGIDRAGRVYFEGHNFDSETGRFTDSVPVVRWDPRTDRADIVARVWSGGRVNVKREGGVASIARSILPFPAIDAWAVMPDGRVAIVHASPHRITFVDDGKRTETVEMKVPELLVTGAERDAYRERDERRMVAAGGGQTRRAPPVADAQFPRALPSFIATGVLVSPRDELWIPRSFRHADRTRRYDVVDGTGRHVATVTLTADRAVVGLGANAVYVARTDPDDGLVYLERFLPR
jgi:hypothetical protein